MATRPSRAVRAKHIASVEDPSIELSPLEQGNPAALSESTDERDTMPTNWWSPPVQSSRVASAGYDPGSQRLYVLFHRPFPEGTPWTYEGVPPNVWRNMRRSASPGRFVNRVLNQYNYHPGQWG